jgi:hypothetical protein
MHNNIYTFTDAHMDATQSNTLIMMPISARKKFLILGEKTRPADGSETMAIKQGFEDFSRQYRAGRKPSDPDEHCVMGITVKGKEKLVLKGQEIEVTQEIFYLMYIRMKDMTMWIRSTDSLFHQVLELADEMVRKPRQFPRNAAMMPRTPPIEMPDPPPIEMPEPPPRAAKKQKRK